MRTALLLATEVPEPVTGELYSVYFGTAFHLGVYVGDGKIVHYLNDDHVYHVSWEQFLEGRMPQHWTYPDLPVVPVEEIVRTALAEVGKTYKYNLLTFNCEHFAIYCKSGGQVKTSRVRADTGEPGNRAETSLAGDGGGAEYAGRGMAGIPPGRSFGKAAFPGDPADRLDRDDVADASEPRIRARLTESGFDVRAPNVFVTTTGENFYQQIGVKGECMSKRALGSRRALGLATMSGRCTHGFSRGSSPPRGGADHDAATTSDHPRSARDCGGPLFRPEPVDHRRGA